MIFLKIILYIIIIITNSDVSAEERKTHKSLLDPTVYGVRVYVYVHTFIQYICISVTRGCEVKLVY